jgi:hypothetical protein
MQAMMARSRNVPGRTAESELKRAKKDIGESS